MAKLSMSREPLSPYRIVFGIENIKKKIDKVKHQLGKIELYENKKKTHRLPQFKLK